jgi:hypothetical protein
VMIGMLGVNYWLGRGEEDYLNIKKSG